MAEPAATSEERARRLAEKLVALAEIVTAQEGWDLVQVSTAEICKAMGKPEGARLEEVRDFVRRVLIHLRGRGTEAACGCGLLSLQVGPEGYINCAVAENRDLRVLKPDDIDDLLPD